MAIKITRRRETTILVGQREVEVAIRDYIVGRSIAELPENTRIVISPNWLTEDETDGTAEVIITYTEDL